MVLSSASILRDNHLYWSCKFEEPWFRVDTQYSNYHNQNIGDSPLMICIRLTLSWKEHCHQTVAAPEPPEARAQTQRKVPWRHAALGRENISAISRKVVNIIYRLTNMGQTSIFIASITRTGCPASTLSPFFARTLTTRPAIGATTVPGPWDAVSEVAGWLPVSLSSSLDNSSPIFWLKWWYCEPCQMCIFLLLSCHMHIKEYSTTSSKNKKRQEYKEWANNDRLKILLQAQTLFCARTPLSDLFKCIFFKWPTQEMFHWENLCPTKPGWLFCVQRNRVFHFQNS